MLAAAALVLLLAFVAIETGSQRPLVPLRIFGNRSLRGANLVTLLNTGAMFPMFFFITLYTQDVLGYSAVQSGLAQLPLAATIAASATLALRVVVRVGYKATLVAGLAVVAAGLWWFGAVSPDGSFPGDLLGPSLVVGIGAGAVWVSSMVAATSGADAAEAGLASGLINTSQQLGGGLGDRRLGRGRHGPDSQRARGRRRSAGRRYRGVPGRVRRWGAGRRRRRCSGCLAALLHHKPAARLGSPRLTGCPGLPMSRHSGPARPTR